MRKKRWRHALFPLALSAAMLAGCASGKGDGIGEGAEPAVLKVMYYDERGFYDQYGMLFSALHPEIEIEVVNTQSVKYEQGKDMNEAMLQFIEESKPDVVMLSPDQYKKLSEKGGLMELDANVETKSFDKDGIMPGMLEYIRDLSGGKIYGLVPSFYSQVIYYNKDLFDKHGVKHPTDRMSWDDLFRLAAQFPTSGAEEDRVYGLKLGWGATDLFQLASMIGMSQNLSFVNPNTMQVTIDTDAWKKAFETAKAALDSDSLFLQDPNQSMSGSMSYEDHLLRDPFIGGKVAMTMDGNYIMDQIKEAQNTVKDKAVKNWDMVTMPVDPANPDVSPHTSFNQIFAISAGSAQSEAAWTFLEYIMSDDFARVTSKRQMGNMTVRTQYLADKDGHHYEAFYALRPIENSMYKNYENVPQEFFMNFMGMAQNELKSVGDGSKPLADVLADLQTKGQETLIQAQQKKADAPAK